MNGPFWFVGNDLAVDFANTIAGTDRRPEALHGWPDVARFLAASGVVGEAEARRLQCELAENGGEAEAHAVALALRDLVRDLVVALAAGKGPKPAVVRRLNAELAAVAAYPQLLRDDGGWKLHDERAGPSWRVSLNPIARAAAELVAQPRGSIRKCADAACILYFRDTSQAQARRWCSMSMCGNRAKVAAFARRNASAAEAVPEPGRRR
ncbi:MAG TPA: ABATE domain-containing protein [Anaeromyxobacteraceae bacterium]|nr:ABATE domain-containing protein [Anaeromyxobacteraceae bacterium]